MTASRPELPTHAEALQLSFPELDAKLRRLLGAQLVAYLGEADEGDHRTERREAEGR